MKDNEYSVYIHKNKTNDKIYIGITSQNPESRWGKDGHGYKGNTRFYNAIQKYGWDNFEHIVLKEGMSKDEAENMEIELIKKYNSADDNYGYNMQLGGNAIGKMSDEIKKKISKANKGRYVGENNPNYGKPCPENRKIAAIEANRIPIYQYDRNNGEFISEFYSIHEASRQLGIDPSIIVSVCKYKTKSIGGYIFRYKDTEGLEYGKSLSPKEMELSKNTRLRKVAQYTKEGEFVQEFNSIKEAELFFGKNKGSTLIWHCCNGRKPSALGYVWKYV